MMTKLCFTFKLLELTGKVILAKTWWLHWSCHFGVIFPNIYVVQSYIQNSIQQALGIQQTIKLVKYKQ